MSLGASVDVRQEQNWQILQRVYLPPGERGWGGVKLWYQIRKELAKQGVERVLVSIEPHNVRLALFLQHVLKAEPYGISEGCVDMILEVHCHGKRKR